MKPAAGSRRRSAMATLRHRWATALIAGTVLVAGCGTGTVQCGPCPPSAYVNLVTTDGTRPTGSPADTVHICVQRLACQDVAIGSGTAILGLPPGMTPRQLDGRTVTTVVRATDGPARRVSSVLVYRHEEGVCGCSGASAQVTLDGT